MSDDTPQLTHRQRLFISFYVESRNATKAAILAGYSEKTARQIASRNLAQERIREAIELQISRIEQQPELFNLIRRVRRDYVYLFGSVVGSVKIGVAKDPAERLKNCQIGSPVLLHMIAILDASNAYETERDLHKKYWHRHTRGEWFQLTEDEILEIVMQYGEVNR